MLLITGCPASLRQKKPPPHFLSFQLDAGIFCLFSQLRQYNGCGPSHCWHKNYLELYESQSRQDNIDQQSFHVWSSLKVSKFYGPSGHFLPPPMCFCILLFHVTLILFGAATECFCARYLYQNNDGNHIKHNKPHICLVWPIQKLKLSWKPVLILLLWLHIQKYLFS